MEEIKCVVLGDGAIGKSCLLTSYARNTFPPEYMSEECDDCTMTVTIGGKSYTLGFYVVTEHNHIDHLRDIRYQAADVFLICFSVVMPSSFENVEEKWVPEIRRISPRTPFLLVGTQIDLRPDSATLTELQRCGECPISSEQGSQLSCKLNAVKYIECSALTHEGVKNLFDEAIMTVLSQQKQPKCALL